MFERWYSVLTRLWIVDPPEPLKIIGPFFRILLHLRAKKLKGDCPYIEPD